MAACDRQPNLGWEGAVWTLAERLKSGFGTDIGSFVTIANQKKWNLDIALELLQVKNTHKPKENGRKQ